MTVNAPAAARRTRVRELDFRRPSKFTRDQIRQLERSQEAFCRSAASRLSAELREDVQLGLVGSGQFPYADAMVEENSREALVAVLDVAPLGTQVALICEMDLAHTFVNRLLGGKQPPSQSVGSLTELELAVAECALTSLVETLSVAWNDMADLKLTLATVDTSPMAVELVAPSDPTLLLNLSAALGTVQSKMTLVVPYTALAAILPGFDRHGPGSPNGPRADGMQRAVGSVDVVLRAEVGAASMPVSEVLALGPGDVVRLGRRAAAGAVLHIDHVPVFAVALGRNGAMRAVQVTSTVRGAS